VNNDVFARLFNVKFDERLYPYLLNMEEQFIRASICALERPVIADSTNITRKVRRKYIELAKELDVPAVAVYREVALGDVLEWNDKNAHKYVPERIIRSMFDHLEIPTVDEGFSRVIYSSTRADKAIGLLASA